jgi:hypothetical protein
MTYLPRQSDTKYLRNQLASRIEAHPPDDWSPAFLMALTAVFDLHFAEGGTNKAPVLQLIRQHDDRG